METAAYLTDRIGGRLTKFPHRCAPPKDLRQASIIMAAFLLNAANSPEPLPRMPLPTEPRISDPFEYLDDED